MVTRRDKGGGVTKKNIGTTPGRIARIFFLVAAFVVLGMIFLMIVVPRDRGAVPPPATGFAPEDEVAGETGGSGAEKAPVTDGDDAVIEDDEETFGPEEEEADTVTDVEEEGEEEKKAVDYSGVYVGTGEDETVDSRTVWEVSMELSGDDFVYIEGKVNHVEDTVKGTFSGMEFSILEDGIELKLSATDKDDVFISSKFDRNRVDIFSINDRSQFFLYVTPKKVNIDTALLPGKTSVSKGSTPLIDMSGFLKDDGVVVGMLRSPFVPMVEYNLELVGD
jgi:hypothetical protein